MEAEELDHAQMIIEAVRKEKNYQKNYPVHYMEIASDDAWARDVGPTFVVNGQGQVRGIDWCFNAWGGICDGLYADWEKDDKVASSFCRKRLAASYVNFYITNGGVLIPQFEDEMDAEAVNIIGGLFPGRKVYPVYARDIIVGGGNIHCITQQIPADSGRMGGA